ncbi:hypothetical protein, variant [Aphanomyces astaci]|uniref:Uncharacterized protein n=1 Tax=Aphanomyces astaci TaxID=112090 RepID=W4G129_APHAT|nr:hypothetical protein, variant [Aphanomyces astaci]ETV73417.1 hypothetical protein, variant [Aphanomyces astaci]|eukprot:XP_009836843.1 hypothetical protein, variant [Aphanomyces astaci]
MALPKVPSPRGALPNVSPTSSPRTPSPPKPRLEEVRPPPSPNTSSQPQLPSQNHVARPCPVNQQRTMRPEDFRGMAIKEDGEKAAHRSFVRQLVDGSMRIPVRNPRRGDYDIMQVSIDAHLTLLTWSPLLSSPDARQASSAQTLELEDVVSIVPWTHKMPTKKPSAAELEMASKGGCWYFGVCVAYTKQQRPQQLMLLCHNAAEQEQLVLSFRTLIRNAKQRRSSLQLADAARLTPGMTASHMTPTQPAMPSHHIPLLVRR